MAYFLGFLSGFVACIAVFALACVALSHVEEIEAVGTKVTKATTGLLKSKSAVFIVPNDTKDLIDKGLELDEVLTHEGRIV